MDQQVTLTLQHAELLLQDGRTHEARLLLAAALKRDPASAQAWWLMSQAVEDGKQAMDCLERVLHLDPAHGPARARLEQLKTVPAPVPEPPDPDTFVFSDEEPDAKEEQPIFDLFQPGNAAFEKPEVPVPDWVSRPTTDQYKDLSQSMKPAVPAPQASEVPAWAVPPGAPKRKKHAWILDVIIIGVILCILLSVVSYFVYQDLGQRPVKGIQETQAVAQVLTSTLPQSLPPTWTATLTASLLPSEAPTLTATPVTPTITPTLLYTLTQTPIPSSEFGIVKGKYPPGFTLAELSNGAQVSLSDYEGQAILLFFWATWCPYCQAEIPDLESIYNAYQADGLVVLAIDEGEIPSIVTDYRAANGLTFPILLDPQFDVSRLYEANAVPRHVFIGRSGRIVAVVPGGLTYSGLENHIRAALRVYPTSTP